MPDPEAELALYIHWPYCSRICPYCDFNVYKARRDEALLEAILTDMDLWRAQTGARKLTSIHFGGGTPSLLPAADIAALIEAATTLWAPDPDIEIALEANPSDADEARWKAYQLSGVSRLSLGIQSFNDKILSLLGRNHNGADARQAAELARTLFPSLSFDLIFGSTGQTAEALGSDLTTALSYKPDHLSTYQLTIEPGTAFEKAEIRGEEKAVQSDDSAAFYDLISATLLSSGFRHYEISNFAMPGHRSRHNLTYWRGGDYIGVGPGAHGRVTISGQRYATLAARTPEAYKAHLPSPRNHTPEFWEDSILMTPEEVAEEYLFMGLRIDEGISLNTYIQLARRNLPEKELHDLMTDGWLDTTGDSLKATRKGRTVLDHIIKALLVT